ncbi:MAG: SAM-dependent methyltransferase [Deltaproteobacteria bacterium]|nr:SAM-dependent methyltransferase [Deltaproteobacteria bacterium]
MTISSDEPADVRRVRRPPARLRALLPELEGARCVADIACDHALLAVEVVRTGVAPRAIAIDIAEGPLAAGRRNVVAAGLSDRIELRRGDGFAALNVDEADVAVVAGVGGRSIAAMLRAVDPRSRGLRRLVLSPHGKKDEVLAALEACRWQPLRSYAVPDRGREYVVLVAVPADPTVVSALSTAPEGG